VDLQKAVANKTPSDKPIKVREYVSWLIQHQKPRFTTRALDFEITIFRVSGEHAGAIVVGRIRNKFQPELFHRSGKKGEVGRAGVECKMDPFGIYFSVEPDSLVSVTEQWAKRKTNDDGQQQQCVLHSHS